MKIADALNMPFEQLQVALSVMSPHDLDVLQEEVQGEYTAAQYRFEKTVERAKEAIAVAQARDAALVGALQSLSGTVEQLEGAALAAYEAVRPTPHGDLS